MLLLVLKQNIMQVGGKMKLFRHPAGKKKEDIRKIKDIRDIVDGSKRKDPLSVPAPPAKAAESSDMKPPAPAKRQPRPDVTDDMVEKPPINPYDFAGSVKKHATSSKGNISPPLFIKIERYKEIVRQVQSIRSMSLTLRDALDALFEMEKELKLGLDMTQKTLDRFNASLLELDGSLIRSQGIEIEPHEDTKELESYVRNVYKQVERLKTDMKTITSEL